MPYPPAFFARPTLEVARELVGAVLGTGRGRNRATGKIVEVEAYLGTDDPASHAARGPTQRSSIMFGPAGVAYVYFIYGIYHCLNVVTEQEGRAGAVLIRALEPVSGWEIMARRRRAGGATRTELAEATGNADRSRRDLCNGPGKICQALGIDLSWNGLSFQGKERRDRCLFLEPGPGSLPRIVATPRIGIRKARSARYRFVDAASRCLSRRLPRQGGAD